MTLKEFITHYDYDNSIVLLEGKRVVTKEDEQKLVALGRLLAEKSSKMIFRSGNAEGSDHLFSEGVASVDVKRLQVVTPYSGHRGKLNVAYETLSLTDVNLVAEEEVIYQSRNNKKMEKLIDKYVSGSRDPYSMKAAYIIRDTIKAIGTNDIKPASFGIFYDNLENPGQGGTGHTMNVCIMNDIPIINQNIWLKWLN